MTKIAIISQAEQGVLIDISGCSSLSEAKQYLTSTLQVSSQFWEGLTVDLNLGPLVLTPEQVNEIQSIVSEVGVQPRQIFSLSPITRSSLIQCRLPLGGLGQLQSYASVLPSDMPEIEQQTAVDFRSSGTDSYGEAGRSPVPAGENGGHLTAGEVPDLSCVVMPELDPSINFEQVSTPEPVPVPDLVLTGRTTTPGATFTETSDDFFIPPASMIHNNLSMPNHHIATRTGQSPAQNQTPPSGHPAHQHTAQTPGPRSARPANPATRSTVAPKQALAPVLMMKQTLRSGQRVCHNGHLVIIGDVNPGAELVADGDITVWGALRGMAHAGAGGNADSEIRALKFGAIQLRIAQAIARSPDRNKPGSNAPAGPETARVIDGKIRLSVSDPE